ncbi:MAG TPA: hypothetical protein VF541_01535 [Longimicrobium sp.]|jgi:hypothetical protein
MAMRIRSWIMMAPAALAVFAMAPARAQSLQPRELPSAERMLRTFEDDTRAGRTMGADGEAAVQYALMHPAQVQPAKLDSVLAGLERIATTSDARLSRVRAVMQLGRDSTEFDRMLRIYRASAAHPEVRDMVMSSIGRPRQPQQVEAWITLLRGIVVAPAGQEDFEGASFEAMRQLYALGEPGIAALRDLNARNLARNPEVRALLASWARQNFKLQESAPGR